jgi:hypothetical protein
LKDLKKNIEESHHRHGLGSMRVEELDKVGPGYVVPAPHSDSRTEDEAATSTKAN